MPGDYTRVTYRPRDDHAGVLMQQGRVTLDADFNALVEGLDRRLRAEVLDRLGRLAVSRETPGAFALSFSGGQLLIGPGRAYVDGLLAENHGAGADVFDPLLAESAGADPLAYEDQPYLPAPDPLPAGGTYVA